MFKMEQEEISNLFQYDGSIISDMAAGSSRFLRFGICFDPRLIYTHRPRTTGYVEGGLNIKLLRCWLITGRRPDEWEDHIGDSLTEIALPFCS